MNRGIFVFSLLLLFLVLACSSQNQPAGSSPTTSPPTPSSSASGNWWHPTPGTSWQIQYGSPPIDTALDVKAYNIDLFETDPKLIEQLHAVGRKVVCYFSAGSYEEWRPDAAQFPSAVLGKPLEGWPGERWLDVRQVATLGSIMGARLDLAVTKQCDAVDPDNVDGYTNPSGFPLSAQDQLTYNRWLAAEAHKRGLAIGLKNDLDQIAELVGDFDFSVNEQCFQYEECDKLLPFIQANKPVWGIEYEGSTGTFCPKANQMNFDTIKKKMDLDASREACR